MVIFHSFLYVYQRVPTYFPMKSASDPGPATADLVGGIVPPPPRGAHARQTLGDAAWRFFFGDFRGDSWDDNGTYWDF
jgi:hypothetical protein